MKVRELLSSPDKWNKGAYAVTKDGASTGEQNDNAVAYCLVGAVHKCYRFGPTGWTNFDDVIVKIVRNLAAKNKVRVNYFTGSTSAVIGWNDDKDRTFEEVKALVTELDI